MPSEMVEQILKQTTYRKIDVDALLDPDHPSWIKFDPELGYVPADVLMRDGVDNSYTTYTHEPEGHRKIINYADRACRINTYGNSFTQCQQVSDDETWQERLAAHFGEPIRNFGSGGYGVNTCYRRMMRMEPTNVGAENIILNVFDDDHIRNLDAARWLRTNWYERDKPEDIAFPLHGLPWAHLRWDFERKDFKECEGFCKTDDDLRALTDPAHYYETFKDDQILRLFSLTLGGEEELEEFEQLAHDLGIEIDLRNPEIRAAEAAKLHAYYGFKSTEYLLRKLLSWIEANGKRLLLVLSYGMCRIPEYLAENKRFDQHFIDFLDSKGIPYIDGLIKHADDFKKFCIPLDEYVARYYIDSAGAAVFGHYGPEGNMFFASSMRREIIDWLDPKPPAYCEPAKREGLIAT